MQITLSQFLQRYGKDLSRATEAKLPPLVQEPRLNWSKGRRPMGAQALAITGIAEALRRHGVGILAAEMGTGKTLMGIRAALEMEGLPRPLPPERQEAHPGAGSVLATSWASLTRPCS
jgi:superfamily II DNA or RNA helicase